MAKHRKPGLPSTIYTYNPPSRRIQLIRRAATYLGISYRGRVATEAGNK